MAKLRYFFSGIVKAPNNFLGEGKTKKIAGTILATGPLDMGDLEDFVRKKFQLNKETKIVFTAFNTLPSTNDA